MTEALDYLVSLQNEGKLRVLPLRDAYEEWNGTQAIVVMAFDDGYATDYENAYPLFLERNLIGTRYITVSYIDTYDYLSWNMIYNMRWLKP